MLAPELLDLELLVNGRHNGYVGQDDCVQALGDAGWKRHGRNISKVLDAAGIDYRQIVNPDPGEDKRMLYYVTQAERDRLAAKHGLKAQFKAIARHHRLRKPKAGGKEELRNRHDLQEKLRRVTSQTLKKLLNELKDPTDRLRYKRLVTECDTSSIRDLMTTWEAKEGDRLRRYGFFSSLPKTVRAIVAKRLGLTQYDAAKHDWLSTIKALDPDLYRRAIARIKAGDEPLAALEALTGMPAAWVKANRHLLLNAKPAVRARLISKLLDTATQDQLRLLADCGLDVLMKLLEVRDAWKGNQRRETELMDRCQQVIEDLGGTVWFRIHDALFASGLKDDVSNLLTERVSFPIALKVDEPSARVVEASAPKEASVHPHAHKDDQLILRDPFGRRWSFTAGVENLRWRERRALGS